ncbi:outer membrane protein [Rhodoplanes roseus]|uniref:Outer membrane protein beta-barrel domain-containing protein n=1 Tax=Rhodoplanes roseus TaxID=29409 RepID=A0A327L129_9BRAD|nr:outer membrane beta-barrel protein [Rhodoplanes roseus]RAI43964.1 hypothetical protein CH341_11630 [Rhodoplanes roseus]
MKAVLLASVAFVALAGSASAADMALKAPPMPAPVPAFSWTGCYIGAHAGAASMSGSYTDPTSYYYYYGYGGSDNRGVGAIAGGQLGCNYQVGMLVLGVEGEGYWSGVKQTHEISYGFDSYSTEIKNKYGFDVAARFGIAFDRALVYGKAGWTWGRFDVSSGNTLSTPYTVSGDATLDGLLLGVGLEYALTNNWTFKGEYNYLNYGTGTVDLTICSPGVCFGGYRTSASADMHVVKLGVNYKFGWDAPVVARY